MTNTQATQDTLIRDPLAFVMLAAWLGARPDQVPDTMRVHTCKESADAWQRVADAARAHIHSEPSQ